MNSVDINCIAHYFALLATKQFRATTDKHDEY